MVAEYRLLRQTSLVASSFHAPLLPQLLSQCNSSECSNCALLTCQVCLADCEAVLLKPVGMLLTVFCSGECAQQTVVLSFSSADEEGQFSSSLLPCGGQTNSWLLSSLAHLCTTYAVQHASQLRQFFLCKMF